MTILEETVNVVRLPESEIVVTRKVPMTASTCDELRAVRSYRESLLDAQGTMKHSIPFPTLIAQLIREDFARIPTQH